MRNLCTSIDFYFIYLFIVLKNNEVKERPYKLYKCLGLKRKKKTLLLDKQLLLSSLSMCLFYQDFFNLLEAKIHKK